MPPGAASRPWKRTVFSAGNRRPGEGRQCRKIRNLCVDSQIEPSETGRVRDAALQADRAAGRLRRDIDRERTGRLPEQQPGWSANRPGQHQRCPGEAAGHVGVHRLVQTRCRDVELVQLQAGCDLPRSDAPARKVSAETCGNGPPVSAMRADTATACNGGSPAFGANGASAARSGMLPSSASAYPRPSNGWAIVPDAFSVAPPRSLSL